MPSIAEAIALNRQRISQGGITGAVPVETPAAPSPSVPAPPEAYPNMPSRGVWPASLILATDTTDGSQILQKNAVRSRSFPYPPAIAQINKTVVQATTAAAVSTSIKLETNNITNPSQSVLNLIAGTNITLAATVDGSVTISSTSSGDGLVHGETPWEGDPAFILLRDDFIGGTSANPGELAWGKFGSAAIFQGNGASSFPTRAGVVHILPPASATQSCGIALNAPTATSNEVAQMYPLVDYPSWQTEWIFTFVRQAATSSVVSPFPLVKISMYVGLACWGGGGLISTTDARPANFVGLRFDCDTTAPAISDSTFHFECVSNANGSSATRNNTQGNTFNTGMVPTENVDYKFMQRCVTRGQVQMRLLNSLGGDTGWQTLNVPKKSYSAGTSNDNNGITTYNASGMSTNFAQATAGTILDITGWTGGTAGANFSVINNRFNTTAFDWFDGSFSYGTATSTNQTTAVASFYPAYYFTCEFGNDTEASPSNNRAIQLDFFSFVWNPGVNPSNALTPTATKVRYF